MSKAFVTLHGGLGNQLFQAAFMVWLRKCKGIHAQLIDPGSKGIPGPFSRVCQIDQLLTDEHVLRGAIALILHVTSLSKRWQALFGRIGLVRCISLPSGASNDEVARLDRDLALNAPGITVFYGYWQEAHFMSASAPEMQKYLRPELTKRVRRINQSLCRSDRPSIGETLLVHVRRGDLATVNSALLLGSQYYRSAFSAMLKSGRNDFSDSKAIGIVSDQPELALPLIQALQPSAYVVDLNDPIDVLAALAMAHSRILANSTLSIWAGVLSSADSPTVYSEVWDLDHNHGSELCSQFDWIAANPLA